ncbi:MAG: hypothetical protein UX09_C0015G0028 [Candidatus Uhrbacteria bacterium GW2011_GWE2_45_35]|uniref:AAA+ ATPase domain-containing protein n=2 Tax=Candidatus Uhriibacteriota TaxID=1752732 RepID=A0A0G1LRH6_9BACT|nr:MAG: hypothetical protein UW63_C0017G0012 [Candidatus Uhrbacteria bacterium GW2011_GWF2_44_350]KKU08641.1 MAG: hypothetical protein UX09_C0015G0028 [Candidatus Uhrbacteria bacterium GW2011_GWE2_45_35]HBR80290.1 nucleoside triphosphatase [Candidatus Uhrbacteria bacterium]HCU31592.1 nucleoside triphosphatase [Candidatus Uhrbacteria bacterium]
MVIFLTGEPGSGKTSVVDRLARKYGPLVGGIISREVLGEGGGRIGFDVETIGCGYRRVPLARVSSESKIRVGRYGVDPLTVQEVVVPAICRARPDQLLVIDEIAQMQMSSPVFCAVIRGLMEKGGLPILATVHSRSNPFTDALLARSDVRVFRVNPENRDQVRRAIDDLLWHTLCAAPK